MTRIHRLAVVILAGWASMVECAPAAPSPEQALVERLVAVRQQGAVDDWCERIREAAEGYSTHATPDIDRVRRFRSAMDALAAPSYCERSRFSAVARSVVESGAARRDPEQAARAAIQQVMRAPVSTSACGLPAKARDPLLELVLSLFDPRPRSGPDGPAPRLLESGPGSEAFVVCPGGGGSSAARIADLFAPVIWFSPDEPLRLEKATVPAPLPGDRETLDEVTGRPRPVVYYQIASTRAADAEFGPAADDQPIALRAGSALKIRYFFYYPRDTGTNGHLNDVEGVEVFVRPQPWPLGGEGCLRLMPTKVRGLAHGLTWSANHLVLEDDVACDAVLPITLLIEEGKHASCPDRNGDGAYTPGYDVNLWVREAWGVRDDFGSARLHSRFLAESAKQRRPDGRVYPPLGGLQADVAGRVRKSYDERTSTPGAAGAAHTFSGGGPAYELRGSVAVWERFRAHAPAPYLDHLEGKLREQEFGEFWSPFRRAYKRGLREFVSIEFPLGRGEFLASPTLSPLKRALPMVDGWVTIAPAFGFRDGFGLRAVDVVYSRTAAAPFDWYVLARLSGEEDERNLTGGCCRVNGEFGFKVRFQEQQVPVLKTLIPGDNFLGIRFGVELFRREVGEPYGLRFRGAVGGAAW